MAADAKGERWVWTVLGAISLGLVAAAGYLYQAHQPAWSFRLFIVGLAGFAILILRLLAEIVPPLYAVLSKISRYVLGALRWIGRAIAGAFVAAGAFLLRPFVERIVRGDEDSVAALPQPIPWTAGPNRSGNHGLDSRLLRMDGYRVLAAQFTVFPDYSCRQWLAGFALSPSPDGVDLDNLQGPLCYIFPAAPPSHTRLVCRMDRDIWNPPITAFERKPSFVVGLSIYPGKLTGKFQLSVSVDSQGPTEFPIPSRCARNLVLVAWAEGQEFRVDFTRIHVSWVPE